jgi:hypothetical protein
LPTNFSDAEVAAISTVISQPRLSRYLATTGGDPRRALALYRWNAQISAALMFPLQMCEVSTRNGIVGAIERVYGSNWHVSAAFERSLPNPVRHGPGPSGFSPQRELQQARKGMQTAGKVVAEIKPAFWVAMLTARHDGRLWTPWLKAEFSDFTEPAPEKCRNMLHKEFEEVRKLRNRVAHHEPVFSRDLAADYERLKRIVGWRSQLTADWMHREQGVTALLATRP